MGSISKSFALVLILIVAISSLTLLTAKPASAQTATPTPSPVPIPTPSLPQFNLRYVNSSYRITTTDPYTGTNIVNIYLNDTIEVIVTNQPFNQANANGNALYYQVAEKGHFSDEWSQSTIYPASSSQYTIVDLGFASENGSYSSFKIQDNIPVGGQVDITVIAEIGYFTTVPYYPPGDTSIPMGTTQVFNGKSSGWNTPLTISIPDGSVSASSSSPPANPIPTSTQSTPSTITSSTSPTPTIPEFPSWTIPVLAFIITSAGLLVYFKKHKR
ncbi:MAG: hypothetical protein ABSA79_03545 [Candidatus Bathyarchaeia archaeon]|jgi:hypothetical protein